MYLSFEKLYECDFVGRPATVYSMSHYFEQEGDLVSDPDMTFIAPKDKPESFFPATFQNMLSYTEALYKKDKDVWVSIILNRPSESGNKCFLQFHL
jgi:hypothetical protein